MEWIWDLLSRLPTDIQSSVAFPTRTSSDDFTLPPLKKAKFEASSSRSTLEDLSLQSKEETKGQINDSVYEVLTPLEGRPSIELVFFHGLQLKGSEDSPEAHLNTWRSKDGELWLNWILEKFPEARILSISYSAQVSEKKEKDQRMDIYITTENLMHDLTQARVGQNKCPVVLVGHSIGGLLMKELCVSATEKVARTRATVTQPVRNFLGNLKGLFFYATPHFGTNLADNTNFTNGCLFQDLDPLNKVAARRREEFCTLRQTKGWRTYGMVESEDITLGKFKGLIVPEASARCDVDECYTVQANHFSICRPHSRNSSSFINLLNFIDGLVKEREGQIHNQEQVHKCTGLPQYPVELEARARDVQEKLKGGAVLGIFGMGGIGKTTLARAVFNNMSKDFEYTCFVDNVKGFSINELKTSVFKHFHHDGIKCKENETDWYEMNRKKTLIVMDDTDSVDQLRLLPPFQDFGDGSCLIITGRNKGVFKFYENCTVYEVDFLRPNEATQLFCEHAFGSKDIPGDNSQHLTGNVCAVVEKCGGLPLTLEVMGRYLRNEVSDAVWEETIDNLREAIAIDGGQNEDDKVWATLEVSYKKLSKEAQDMFCDAATFFSEEPLDTFLAAWSDRKAETTWKNLVDRAMVKEVGMNQSSLGPFSTGSVEYKRVWEYKKVWVHEQLRDLAKKLAKETVLYGCAGETKSLLDQLNAEKVNANTKSLQLQYGIHEPLPTIIHKRSGLLQSGLDRRQGISIKTGQYRDSALGQVYHGWENSLVDNYRPSYKLRVNSLVSLEQLRYMAIHGVLHKGDGEGLTGKLRLLRWDFGNSRFRRRQRRRPSFQISLINMNDLAVLELKSCRFPKHFPKTLGNLVNLRSLQVDDCDVPVGFYEAMGNLKKLHTLSLTYLNGPMIQSLPENFGNLSQLKRLEMVNLKSRKLPRSFGQLMALKELAIDCDELEALPNSFGTLKSVRKVALDCPKLERLPNGFGKLSSLEELSLNCMNLTSLSDDFGQLATLKKLTITSDELETLPDRFGALKSVREISMTFPKLERLPDSFYGLSSVEILRINCSGLKSLSDDFGQLATLEDLTISSNELETLLNKIGSLNLVRKIVFHCPRLERLPDDFGGLSSLEELTIQCWKLKSLPDDFGLLRTLKTFTMASLELETLPDSVCVLKSVQDISLDCPKLETLPDSFGGLCLLKELRINCRKLKRLSDDFGHLATLRDLTIESDELETLPNSFGDLKSVRKISLRCPKLERLPDSFGGLSSVKNLRMICSGLKSLSDNLGQLATLEDFTVVSDELETLPDNFGALKSVRKVGLVCKKLDVLPNSFGHLAALEHLEFRRCHKLHVLPDSFGDLSKLRRLDLIDCQQLQLQLQSLPKSFAPLLTQRLENVSQPVQDVETVGELDATSYVGLLASNNPEDKATNILSSFICEGIVGNAAEQVSSSF